MNKEIAFLVMAVFICVADMGLFVYDSYELGVELPKKWHFGILTNMMFERFSNNMSKCKYLDLKYPNSSNTCYPMPMPTWEKQYRFADAYHEYRSWNYHQDSCRFEVIAMNIIFGLFIAALVEVTLYISILVAVLWSVMCISDVVVNRLNR